MGGGPGSSGAGGGAWQHWVSLVLQGKVLDGDPAGRSLMSRYVKWPKTKILLSGATRRRDLLLFHFSCHLFLLCFYCLNSPKMFFFSGHHPKTFLTTSERRGVTRLLATAFFFFKRRIPSSFMKLKSPPAGGLGEGGRFRKDVCFNPTHYGLPFNDRLFLS